MSRLKATVIALACALACTRDGSAQHARSFADKGNAAPPYATASANGARKHAADWTANGATACEKYLTPDVVAAILLKPAGHSRRLDAQSCIYETDHAGSIGIILKVADIDVFRLEVPRIAFAHPTAGVGDGAYWNPGGGFAAVKGHDRGCDISVLVVPYNTKIHDEALARKLGDICNTLFALP